MGGIDKLWHPIAGRPVLAHTIDVFETSNRTGAIVVVVSADRLEDARALCRRHGWSKVVAIAPGRERRQDSVRCGLAEIARVVPACGRIMIHDGARPLVTHEIIASGLDALAICGAAIPVVPAHDTVKEIEPVDPRVVRCTRDRGPLRLAQTPQIFSRELIERAYDAPTAEADASDDAILVERLGERVATFPGSRRNVKITTADDLVLAELLLDRTPTMRIGMGFDQHPLSAGGPLVLGGVVVPFDRGLAGHSDADALLHAIVDAVLGAAALGDIGAHFPSSDPRWKGQSSALFLEEAARLVRAEGWTIGNIDATIIAERPVLAPHVHDMRVAIAKILGIEPGDVSVKAKTANGLGSIGRGEGIACHALATISRSPASPSSG
jgi:2-C-methyl-D-erythritol 2,4-cyclodiphosphate synthase/2-C-methyl-D-erythritol 4-phosphate cytidylyltransferase